MARRPAKEDRGGGCSFASVSGEWRCQRSHPRPAALILLGGYLLYVLLPPTWLREANPKIKPVQFDGTLDEALAYNNRGYNLYYYPNYPSITPQSWVKAHEVDAFEYVFVDMDLKEGFHASKEAFIALLLEDTTLDPTSIVDSGGGIHAYWRVSDLDAMSFLKLSRRLARKFQTDLAVQQLKQLMRVPGSLNTKNLDDFKLCEEIYRSEQVYTCEQLDGLLPPLQHEDEAYCREHYEKAYDIGPAISVDDKLPLKFSKLLRDSQEVNDIWVGKVDDRSKGDYRLGHIMFASGFTKDEAMSVLVNSAKALERSSAHRVGYAQGIVEKIWTYEEQNFDLDLSSTVQDILNKSGDQLAGTRFPCHKYLDDTENGFRLGHVIGLVAGVGVGKTAIGLNMFKGFVELNPEYDHVLVTLEQPANEIAKRWKNICGNQTNLHSKVHVISNYADDGSYRNLSLDDIRDYILKLQKIKKIKIGCVVIDHIGVLKKSNSDGRQSIQDICDHMKAFAIATQTLLVMQSQAPREKAGIGDIELNKDAAYGTVFFEAYCDYLVTLWQPLKRCYDSTDCPTVLAYKFCKIRHKNKGLDVIQEDVPYRLYFNTANETLRELTQQEEKSFDYYLKASNNKRDNSKKHGLIVYTSIKWEDKERTG